jgi:ribonuclease HI
VATQIQSACSPNKGEALAALLAVSLASSLHLDRFVIEGDSQIVILALQQPNIVQDWRITDIIQQTLDMFPPDSSWSVRKSIEVQTSVPTMWHIGPQLDSSQAAFPLHHQPSFLLLLRLPVLF